MNQPSQDQIFANMTNGPTWIRLVYMVIYGIILHLAGMLMWILCSVQFIFTLLFGQDNENIRKMCATITQYIQEALTFVSYNGDAKPFPFCDNTQAKTEESTNSTTHTAADSDIIDGSIEEPETAAEEGAKQPSTGTSESEQDNTDSRP
ncbi:DUF4389 domain-containing protein [Simiduia aestuariiviva]|uniref:DUF4389 domain-containing protein n=1 Tax=Simiduia aestuariiviva TaxID=1510459 RepID=A0A839UQ23_9GAMM|nr:DUF4389 domain-containing protein [Simiduia aestuariiviva]MBB3167638.1 hypothetical protein [Simiduia aestuariiviva]